MRSFTRLSFVIALACVVALLFQVHSVAGKLEFTETYSEFGISFRYPKGMNIGSVLNNTADNGGISGHYVAKSLDTREDHSFGLVWIREEVQSPPSFHIDSIFRELRKSLPTGAGVERQGDAHVRLINSYSVTFEGFSVIVPGKTGLAGGIGVWKLSNTLFVISVTAREQATVDRLLDAYLGSFSYVPAATSVGIIFPSWLTDVITYVAIIVVLSILYKVFRARTRKRLEDALKQSLPVGVSAEDAVQDPLRCTEIKRWSSDKSCIIAFTAANLLVIRLGLAMDATMGWGMDTSRFEEIHQLFIGRDEKTIMKIAKGSYTIPLSSITDIRVRKGKLGDKIIEINTSKQRVRFRTGEDSDRIKNTLSRHTPNKFTSELW